MPGLQGLVGNVGPASRSVAITPDDSNDLAQNVRAIHINATAGDITVVLAGDPDGTTRMFYADKGAFLPIVCKRVMDTGTDMTSIIGLYD